MLTECLDVENMPRHLKTKGLRYSFESKWIEVRKIAFKITNTIESTTIRSLYFMPFSSSKLTIFFRIIK
jgi:hypothetical protein